MSERITIQINTDNADFSEGPSEYEVARILRELADSLEDCGLYFALKPLRDFSGNAVGFCRVSAEVTL